MSITAKPAENPEQYKDVAEMRLRGDDVTRMLGLYAADRELEKACQDPRMKERVSRLKNGWRDLRAAQTMLARVTDAIQWTVPVEKRVGFRRSADRCTYVVMQGPLASKPRPNEEEMLTTRELDELVSSAWEGKCQMCITGKCDRCDLGKVLDNLVGQDRAGGCWGTMDIRRR